MMTDAKRWLLTLAVVLIPHQGWAAADGRSTYIGRGTNSQSGTWYAGLTNNSSATLPTFWATSRSIGSCYLSVQVATAPGATSSGKKWDIALRYNTSATADSNNCVDDIGNLTTSSTLCSITETQKNCTATVSFGGSPPAINSCMQIVATAVSSPTATGDTTWSLFCDEASGGDGISTMGGADTGNFNAFYEAGEFAATNDASSLMGMFIVPVGVGACSGAEFHTNQAAATSGTRPIKVRVSTAGGGASNGTLAVGTDTVNCKDLTFTSSAAKCTIGGGAITDKHCTWAIDNTISTPIWSCMGIFDDLAGSANATGGELWNLACSTDTSAPYATGGPMFIGAGPTGYSATMWMGQYAYTGNNLYTWIVNGDRALPTCNIGLNLGAAAGTGASWVIKARVTSAPSATQNCLDVSAAATETTLCTMGAGDKSCTAAAQALSVPAGGCIQLKAEASAAPTPINSGGQIWSIQCAETLPTPASTETPTPTPTATPTPTGGATSTPVPMTPGIDCCEFPDGRSSCDSPCPNPGVVINNAACVPAP